MSILDILNLANLTSTKDTRWLELEVCREFQRNKCPRAESECKFAHASNILEVRDGRVIACYDSIRCRCNRTQPKCKYFHPPEHLRVQLLANGKRYLELKNAIRRQVGLPVTNASTAATLRTQPVTPTSTHQPQSQIQPQPHPHTQPQQIYNQQQPASTSILLPGQLPMVTVNPYIMSMNHGAAMPCPQYFGQHALGLGSGSPYGILPPALITQQKIPQYQRMNTIHYENLAFPGMVVCKTSPLYKSAAFQTYQPNLVTYLKPRIEDNLILNQAKIAKVKFGQKLKRC